MQCNPMLIERWRNKRSSEDVRWRSFLRWGTVKVKLLETNVPQKILMIRFETHLFFKKKKKKDKRLMENQIKLSCFSPVSVHLEIWLQLFWRLLDQNQSRFDSNKLELKEDVCTIRLKDLLLDINSQSDERRHGADCVRRV